MLKFTYRYELYLATGTFDCMRVTYSCPMCHKPLLSLKVDASKVQQYVNGKVVLVAR